MCRSCHDSLSDAIIKKQLEDALIDPKFEVWNSTSLSHIMLAMSGYNGYEVSEIAQQLFRNMIEYLKSDGPDAEDLNKIVDAVAADIQKCRDEGLTNEQLKEKVRHMISSTN